MIEALPQWRCHKVVGAFKIHAIKPCAREGYYRVYPELTMLNEVPIVEVPLETFRARVTDNSRPVRFPDEYIGGYLVQYEDGYLSWSPAKAFEDGYTRIG